MLAGLLDHVDEVGGVLDLGQLLEVAVDLVVGPRPEYPLDEQLEMGKIAKASKVSSCYERRTLLNSATLKGCFQKIQTDSREATVSLMSTPTCKQSQEQINGLQ